MRATASIFLVCAAFGCSARAGGGGFVITDEDAGTVAPTDVVIPGVDVVIPRVDVVIPGVDVPGLQCAPPEFLCGGRCANLLTDGANCGTCGRSCAAGQSCSAGSCVGGTGCAAPNTMCGGSCTDVRGDNANCGRCGNACASGQTCSNGACTGGTTTCTAPTVFCNGRCVNTQTDAQNCGICGLACASGQSCVNGGCGGSACIAPRMTCAGVCVDVLSSTANCGACGRACTTGQTCTNGNCVTSSGTLDYRTVTTGRRCSSDLDCSGAQTCVTTAQGRVCTDNAGCTQGARVDEEAECGGRGSTCLLYGSTATQRLDICLRGCVPTATSEQLGACAAGFVCTTNWLRQPMGSTETAAGCMPHCTTDSHCAGVVLADAGAMRCNTRTGLCTATGNAPTLLADGAACNPMVMVPQCRGTCFSTSGTVRTQGLCGSFINLRDTQVCPDYPADQMAPRVPTGDNLAVCIFRNCTRNSGCTGGLLCTYPEDTTGMVRRDLPSSCGYATTAQPNGIP